MPAAATSTLSLVSSSQPARGAIADERETGALFAFPPDAAAGIKNAATSLGWIDKSLCAFAVTGDGTKAYAISPAGQVQQIQLIDNNSAGAALGGLPAGSQASALWVLETAAQHWLLVASRTDQSLYVLDLGAATLLATLKLDHPPEQVAATGLDGAYVVEEEGGAQYLQQIDLAPLATGQPAVLAGARQIGGTGLRIVAFDPDGSASLLAPTAAVDGTCEDLLWSQLEECADCETANCVLLATIERYQAGAAVLDGDPVAALADDLAQHRARIDNREGRRVLASTATLQAWLECLQTQGAQGPQGPKGDQGPPGLGLYGNLPKILDIGWTLEQQVNLIQFMSTYKALATSQNAVTDLKRLVTAGGASTPWLTLYFNKPLKGINRQTLRIWIDVPLFALDAQGQIVAAGIYFPLQLKLYGQIIEIPSLAGGIPTRHTGERAPYAVSFLPAAQFFTPGPPNPANSQVSPSLSDLVTGLALINSLGQLEPPRVMVELHGDFVWAPDAFGNYSELAVLDGNNVGGQVGNGAQTRLDPPIQGGKNPSGDLTQGGLFESWFMLTAGKDYNPGPVQEKARAARPLDLFNAAGVPVPAVASLSSPQQIEAAGVPAELAARIAQERGRRPFASAADLRKRLQLADADWALLQSKLVLL
jgi:hypothetical protein